MIRLASVSHMKAVTQMMTEGKDMPLIALELGHGVSTALRGVGGAHSPLPEQSFCLSAHVATSCSLQAEIDQPGPVKPRLLSVLEGSLMAQTSMPSALMLQRCQALQDRYDISSQHSQNGRNLWPTSVPLSYFTTVLLTVLCG